MLNRVQVLSLIYTFVDKNSYTYPLKKNNGFGKHFFFFFEITSNMPLPIFINNLYYKYIIITIIFFTIIIFKTTFPDQLQKGS